MYSLTGVGNPGFSFTKTYLDDISVLVKFVNRNLDRRDLTYKRIQAELNNGSRIRMIVPFLKYMGIVDNVNFTGRNNGLLNMRCFFTRKAKPFLLLISIYEQLGNNPDEFTKYYSVFRKVLNKEYLLSLCIEKKEYRTIIEYLVKYNHLDKNEFFAITTYKFGEWPKSMYENVDDWIIAYRSGDLSIADWEITNNVNCYSYMMQLLVDFHVCDKTDEGYTLCGSSYVKRVVEV